MSELNEVEKYDLTTDTIDLFYDRVINILSVDHTFTVRATENHGSETVVFRGPPASHDARTWSHDGLCTATTAAIRELTERIRKTAEAIPDSPRKNTEA